MTLPNDLILSQDIHNFTRDGQRRIDIPLVVGYDSDLDACIEAVRQALVADERVLSEPAPEVVVEGFGPRGVTLEARSWVATADFGPTRSDLHRAVLSALRSSRITIRAAAPIAVVEG